MPNLSIPTHIGYIVDGNRRWAKRHGLPTYEGHLAGYNTVQEIAKVTFSAGVKYMSIYTFSTENWQRNQDEVSGIMNLVIKLCTSDLHLFTENKIKLKVIGSRHGVSEKLLKTIDNAEKQTSDGEAGMLAVCFNYGGQLEIADAVKKIIQSGAKPSDVTPELIAANLYEPEIPPIDILVRTSGEQRLSNFMLWRAAYSELMFVKKMWPDMKKEDVNAIIREYSRRNRRFGG